MRRPTAVFWGIVTLEALVIGYMLACWHSVHAGSERLSRGEWALAARDLRLAARLAPYSSRTRASLASALVAQAGARKSRPPGPAQMSAEDAQDRTALLQEALTVARSAVRVRPIDASAHAVLGRVLRELGRTAEAVEEYRSALALGSHPQVSHLGLGRNLRELGKLAEAEASYRSALRADDTYAEALSGLCQILLARGELCDAVSLSEGALVADPEAGWAHDALGNALVGQGRAEEAVPHLRRAVSLSQDEPYAHFDLAWALHRLGRDGQALASLERAEKLRPGDSRIRKAIAMCHQAMGAPQQAFEELLGISADAPEDIDVQHELVIAAKDLGPNALEQALSAIREAMGQRPDKAELHTAMGKALDELGRRDEALMHLRKGAQGAGRSIYAQREYALALARSGEQRKAREVLDKAAMLARQRKGYLTAIAGDYLEVGAPAPAAELLERAQQEGIQIDGALRARLGKDTVE